MGKDEFNKGEFMTTRRVSNLLFSIIASGMTSTAALAANGIFFGESSVAGAGCYQLAQENVEITDSEILQRISLLVKKDDTEAANLKRSVCTLALPFQLEDGKKLVLKDVMISGFANLAATTSAKTQTEVFLAGGHGDIQKIEIAASQKRQKKYVSHSASLDVESTCGGSGILRTNSSAILQGGENLRSTLRMDGLTTQYEIQDCEE